MTGSERVLVIACGALAREILDITTIHHLDHVTVECLPAKLHNHPELIPGAVRDRIRRARAEGHDQILVGYADCGTGGRLQRVCSDEGATMMDGAHCYQFFAGQQSFLAMHDEAPGTLYLTDFLARHFDRLIWEGFGIAEHPELRDMYFGNYTRVVHLAQTHDPEIERYAIAAAERLGLDYETTFTGYGELEPVLVNIAGAVR